jgi:hypothetical protein
MNHRNTPLLAFLILSIISIVRVSCTPIPFPARSRNPTKALLPRGGWKRFKDADKLNAAATKTYQALLVYKDNHPKDERATYAVDNFATLFSQGELMGTGVVYIDKKSVPTHVVLAIPPGQDEATANRHASGYIQVMEESSPGYLVGDIPALLFLRRFTTAQNTIVSIGSPRSWQTLQQRFQREMELHARGTVLVKAQIQTGRFLDGVRNLVEGGDKAKRAKL